MRSLFNHSGQCLDLSVESSGSLAWCFGGGRLPHRPRVPRGTRRRRGL